MRIANIKKIVKPVWAHKPGYGMGERGGKRVHLKQDVLEQGTTPKDSKLLNKLGIRAGDKVLSVAGYYATWASAIKNAGAKVDYSDVSMPIVNWVKKNVGNKFGKIICSGYEKIPREPLEYDWTFTYEACGGGRGLPIAYLRSLLNKKGGILMMLLDESHVRANQNKVKRYPAIVKNLAKVYGIGFKVERKKIWARRKARPFQMYKYLICTVLTNDSAREKAEMDLRVLDYSSGKSVIDIEKCSRKLKISVKELKSSLRRLGQLSKSHGEDMVKDVEVR